MDKNVEKNISESLHCTEEINITLYINYTSTTLKKKKTQRLGVAGNKNLHSNLHLRVCFPDNSLSQPDVGHRQALGKNISERDKYTV